MAFNPDLFGINIGQEFQDGFGWGGVNKGFPTFVDAYTLTSETLAQFVNDVRYLKSLGFTRFRMAIGDYSFTQRTAYHLQMLEALAQIGNIHLEWGSLPLNNPAGFSGWIDAINSTAQSFQTILNTYTGIGVTGAFALGNENEYNGGSSDVTSITRASNVVTVVTPFKHALSAEWKIRVTDSTVLSNGNYTIASVVNDYTFTISSEGSNGSQNAGKITYNDPVVNPTIRNQIKKVATTLKGLSNPAITMPLSYSCVQNKAVGYEYHPYYWKDDVEGRGDVDYVDLNIYSSTSSSDPETNWLGFKTQVDQLYTDLGSENSRITEWNTFENDTTAPAMNNNLAARNEMLMRKKNYMESLGFKHYFFAYRMPSVLAEKHPAYNNNGGGIRPSLFKLIGKRSPYVEIIPQ